MAGLAAEVDPGFPKILGRTIRSLRERQGLTQGQLAHRVQPYINRATIGRIEAGELDGEPYFTSLRTVQLLLDAMGLKGRDLQREIGDTRVKRQGRRQVSRSEPIQPPLANVV